MEKLHIPVLLSEVLASLQPQPGESYLDLTAGFGGHAKSILDVTRNYKDSALVDRDQTAISSLEQQFKDTGIRLMHTDFYSAMLQLLECGNTFDMILADFGVSSPQLDTPSRGFSLKHAGPLDMRMDTRQSLTAGNLVNHSSERELSELFVKYGEEPLGHAQLLARAIVHARPLSSTTELASLVARYSRGHSRVHPATRVFQALRIAVNGELEEIEHALPLLPQLLKPRGRVAIITFHSLEDRLVKDYFREASSHGEESPLQPLTKKPLVAAPHSVVINPRARSAKLRAAIRQPG